LPSVLVSPGETIDGQAAQSAGPLVAYCSSCGIAPPLGLLVPGGGQACSDIHWYCTDPQVVYGPLDSPACQEAYTCQAAPAMLRRCPGSGI
jgi:hypothetical protein